MQFSTLRLSASLAFVLASLLSPSLAAPHDARSQNEITPAKRAIDNREAALATLSPVVRADLEKLSPDDYQLFLNHDIQKRDDKFVGGGPAHDADATWINGHGPGIGNCANGIAITLDDGPYQFHESISKNFSEANQIANFFVNGLNCIYDPANVRGLRRAHALGHYHFSHTWSHVNLTSGLTYEQIDRQVQLVEDALWKILGVVPAFIRPPYGETNRTIINYLTNRWGYKVIQWDRDAGDAAGNSTEQSTAVYADFKTGERHLILNHEVKQPTADVVIPYALKHLAEINQPSIGVHQCLRGQPSPYKVVGKKSKRDATWTCEGTPAPGKP
ncbi:unnamed protein product [Tilletia controversa]|uniref:NodB homology domain-containing protein n=2 Tax=Tilletia TaxID=13289 RepID=A0A8X7MX30_9BASI|nr:hypothetical protein A4X06_0g1750 [Tilletia controversa]KAE8264561.1 hypothetical protein A4X03_0g855 [Tilletia caries]CAD6936082.1 unnamed protein product [Tilletia controversa]CAD6971303.1 unnamed protein product [Tilletia controversa]